MKTIVIAFLLAITFSAYSQKKTPKAVFIIVDGIPADLIIKLQPPGLMQISRTGSFTRSFTGGVKDTYNQTPTISAPGYNNLITGVWGNKHNVWDNDINDPNYNYWNIFRIVKKVNPSLKTAIFSTWTDNRTKLVGEGLLDYSYDGLELDSIKYPHDKDSNYIRRIDSLVALNAASYIQDKGPDLSWVYLEYTDDMAHRYGDSNQFNSAVLNADQQIKKIWDAVNVRQQSFNEDWLFIVTTDHGRAPLGKDHGGQSERERTTWIVTNYKNLNERFHHMPAVVDILPSITNHLGITIPDEQRSELDGIPFIGPLDITDLKATRVGSKIILEWKSYVKDDRKAEIFISVTNNFRKGDKDEYLKVGEAAIKQQKYQVTFASQSDFFKILVKTNNQVVNTWIAPRK